MSSTILFILINSIFLLKLPFWLYEYILLGLSIKKYFFLIFDASREYNKLDSISLDIKI